MGKDHKTSPTPTRFRHSNRKELNTILLTLTEFFVCKRIVLLPRETTENKFSDICNNIGAWALTKLHPSEARFRVCFFSYLNFTLPELYPLTIVITVKMFRQTVMKLLRLRVHTAPIR